MRLRGFPFCVLVCLTEQAQTLVLQSVFATSSNPLKGCLHALQLYYASKYRGVWLLAQVDRSPGVPLGVSRHGLRRPPPHRQPPRHAVRRCLLVCVAGSTYTVYMSVSQRLKSRLTTSPGGCREWQGCLNTKGYGQISVTGRMTLVHRIAWTLAVGPIPEGMFVCHRCDNPPCCQTDPTEGYPNGHLFLGTNADNLADMSAKGRGRGGDRQKAKTHCPHGHPYDATNTVLYGNKRLCRACRAVHERNRPPRRKMI